MLNVSVPTDDDLSFGSWPRPLLRGLVIGHGIVTQRVVGVGLAVLAAGTRL